MPNISTQTNACVDVINQLNEEFDKVAVDYSKLYKDYIDMCQTAHKEKYKAIMGSYEGEYWKEWGYLGDMIENFDEREREAEMDADFFGCLNLFAEPIGWTKRYYRENWT